MYFEHCNCITNKKEELGARLKDIWDEVVELVEVQTWDEFLDEWSDVVFGLGRLVGWLYGVNYVSVYGDQRHVNKIKKRMQEYGCVRSKRHLSTFGKGGAKCNSICCSKL
jgi:hypothetical protein